jgi:UrcA family protein
MTAVTVNYNRSPLSRVAVLAACLLAGTLGVARAAAPLEDGPSLVVSYGDLDLSSADGVRALYKRIALAAREVCPREGGLDLAGVTFAHACRAAAIERAVARINNPQLAALSSAEHTKRG